MLRRGMMLIAVAPKVSLLSCNHCEIGCGSTGCSTKCKKGREGELGIEHCRQEGPLLLAKVACLLEFQQAEGSCAHDARLAGHIQLAPAQSAPIT